MTCCLARWAFERTALEGSPFASSTEPRYVTRCIRAILSPSTVSASGISPPPMCIQTVFVGAIFILCFRRVVTNLVTRSCALSGESAARTRSSSYSKCCRVHCSLLFRAVRGTPLLSPCGKTSSSIFCRNRLNRMGPSFEP